MATEPTTKAAEPPGDPLAPLYGVAPVVVARAASLQPLQALCHEKDDVVPTLLTARYRLRGGPVFGNLLVALANDVRAVAGGTPGQTLGDLLPAPEPDSLWPELAQGGQWPTFDAPDGRVHVGWVQALMAAIASALPSHRRLVLFCEVEGGLEQPLPEWMVIGGPAISLPRNFTIVVSDAPRGWTGPEVEAPQGAAGSEEVFTFVEAALSGDQAAEVDRLGVAPLADGLARLIMLPQTRPLTVGVQAPWGWGKSSFVAFVRNALVRHAPANLEPTPELVQLEALDAILAGDLDHEERGSDAEVAVKRRNQAQQRRELLQELERRATRDVICVSFNAWRYEGSEQVWAGLARAITAAMEGTLSWRARLWSRIVYAYRRRKLEFWLGFVAPVVLAMLVAVLAIALGVADAGDELSGWTEGIAAVVAPAAAFLLIAWRFLRVIQPVSVQVAGYVQGPDYAAHMGYQNEVIEDLKFLHERVEGEPRVVVCVDDLDRCSDESIMETLQAINLVLGASDFFVVLAIDPDMIYRAIARQRGISDEDEAAEVFAENYLRKIIQLPLVLPGRSADQRFGFVSQLFSPAAQREFRRAEETVEPPAAEPPPADDGTPFTFDPGAIIPPRVRILREVQDTKDELEALEASRHLLNDNPRELKRLVNVHRLVKILLQRPDAPPTPDQQRKLMAWLVFCAAKPGDVDDLLAQAATRPDDDEHALVTVGAERLSAHDLAPDGTLARAARISLLVRDRPATPQQPAAASGRAARPGASPS
jgi:KAP family P-loop domain